MFKTVSLFLAAVILSGCATSGTGTSQGSDEYAEQNALRKTYRECLKRNNKNADKCKAERERLLDAIEYQELQDMQ